MDIFERLGKKCAEITPESMILQYVAPQHKMHVTLNDDDDVLNMIHLHMCMKLTMIELKAESKDEHFRSQNVRRKKRLLEGESSMVMPVRVRTHSTGSIGGLRTL